jgi:metal-responsive CopG/Arc/MetJ family transcriptional regulator
MKTIQMTLDEELVRTVDDVVKSLRTTRSAFIREALRQAVKSMHIRRLEERHRLGYMKKPAANGEFDVWEAEQKWGDE